LRCYKRILDTGQFIKNRNLFLAFLEAGKSKIKEVLVREGFFLIPRWSLHGIFSGEEEICVFTWEKVEGQKKPKLLSTIPFKTAPTQDFRCDSNSRASVFKALSSNPGLTKNK
jgi:hypothetical protein